MLNRIQEGRKHKSRSFSIFNSKIIGNSLKSEYKQKKEWTKCGANYDDKVNSSQVKAYIWAKLE